MFVCAQVGPLAGRLYFDKQRWGDGAALHRRHCILFAAGDYEMKDGRLRPL